MTESTTLTFTETIQATPAAIVAAFTQDPLLRQWLCNQSQVNGRMGGKLYLEWQQGFTVMGEFTQIDPDSGVAFTWQGRNEPFVTRVAVTLTSDGGQTAVSLAHSDIPSGEQWASVRQELTDGWKTGLTNLKSVLETGLDQRVYGRPFLGILIAGTVPPEQAEAMGLPIAGGIRINGTAEGSGAAAMGLENGDVIVNIGGTETADYYGLQAAIRPFQVGESVKITFYRHGEKQSELMKLGPRPAPQLPESSAAFAASLRALYDQQEARMDDAVRGMSDADAREQPADGEWSVMDILAHLTSTERYLQQWLATLLSGAILDDYPNNPAAVNVALTAVYPTLSAIMDAWKTALAETVALIEALPESFIQQKAFCLMAVNSLQVGYPFHTDTHIDEIAQRQPAATQYANK